MRNPDLKKYWLVNRFANSETANLCFCRLLQHYSNPDRYYHNLDHLKDLFVHFETSKFKLANPDWVVLAIFYHDAIYEVKRSDNELVSAAYAQKDMTALGFSERETRAVVQMIEATAKHFPPPDTSRDLRYFLDFDLAILGAEQEVYAAYAKKIRQEYAIYPDEVYQEGRKNVLEKLSNRDQLFQTQDYFELYEKKARENIQWEIGNY